MNPRIPFLAATAALVILGITGCASDTSTLEPATASTDPVVFSDGYGEGATFEAFEFSKLDAVQIVTNEKYAGTASLAVAVPAKTAPDGNFAGGAFTTTIVRDLTGYDALTFWAKASRPEALNVGGLGNDNTGESLYEASTEQLALTTSWQKYIIPIPLPEKLDLEAGLFFFAEGLGDGEEAYTIWFDEIQYEATGIVSDPRPAMPSTPVTSFVGSTLEIQGTTTVLNVGGADVLMRHLPGYFTFASSNEAVAIVEENEIRVVGGGDAEITAMLGEEPVSGTVPLGVLAPPTTAPAVPTLPAADVISLISNNPLYANRAVDKWSGDFDNATVSDIRIAGTDVKAYLFESLYNFCAIEFTSQVINATAAGMTDLHLDIWLPDGDPLLLVKLVDFGPNGVYDESGDDSEAFVVFQDPPIMIGGWISLDIPLADFTDLDSTEHLAQLILQRTTPTTAYVTNIYFHR